MKLQKPGSGLPNIERLFIKNFFVPILRTFFTWNIALFLFIKSRLKCPKNFV